jgi:hypothetical protein
MAGDAVAGSDSSPSIVVEVKSLVRAAECLEGWFESGDALTAWAVWRSVRAYYDDDLVSTTQGAAEVPQQ